MSECTNCQAKAHNAFLCPRCITTLQTALADLPWWLARLTEAAIGQTRMGDGGRSGGRREPFKGDDDVLTRCKCGHSAHEDQKCEALDREIVGYELIDGMEGLTRPVVAERPCGCADHQPAANGAKLRAQLLAAGGVNARAADLYDEIHNMLSTWVRDVCETRGLDVPTLRTATGMARWLTECASAIAAGEGAGECLRDVRDATERIERAVNRPIPMRWLGKCPTWLEDKREACGSDLRCRADAVEVYCRACRQTHNPDRLQLLMMNDLERKNLTWTQLLKANKMQPEEYQVKERELRRWRQHGLLKPRAYKRPDGREVPTWHSDEDEPLYRWPDVRRLRAEPKEVKAG